jgi:hypothetical protein
MPVTAYPRTFTILFACIYFALHIASQFRIIIAPVPENTLPRHLIMLPLALKVTFDEALNDTSRSQRIFLELDLPVYDKGVRL